ncbi:MAG: hypothetical protein ACJ74T_01310 [Pyrinomonadaceae bacterium]
MNDELKASCIQFIVHRSYFIVPTSSFQSPLAVEGRVTYAESESFKCFSSAAKGTAQARDAL